MWCLCVSVCVGVWFVFILVVASALTVPISIKKLNIWVVTEERLTVKTYLLEIYLYERIYQFYVEQH